MTIPQVLPLGERRGWTPVVTFVAIAAVLFTVVWLANVLLPDATDWIVDPDKSDTPPPVPLESLLGGWAHWDAGWYVTIADVGYYLNPDGQSPVAFFPAYPLAIRGVTDVFGSPSGAAIAVTFVCGLAAAVLWWEWLTQRLAGKARRLAFLSLLLWPYAWYLYGAIYADALFLAAALAAFVLVDRDRPVLAGLAGAVATAARPVGVAVTVGLVAVVLQRRRRPGAVRPADLGVLLSLAGLAAWSLWLRAEFGDPLAFVAAQDEWGQGAGPATWFKFDFFELLVDGRRFFLVLIPHAVATVTFLAMVPTVWRRFGWGYGLYTLVVIAIPAVGSGTFQGLGRYLLAAFPVYAVAGEWLAERVPLARRTIPLSAAGLVAGAALFSMGFYLA